MTVALPSTPASYFHLLRRHVHDGIRRPLIVFTPKSMLRNKHAVSQVADFTEDKFRSVLLMTQGSPPAAPTTARSRDPLVSGKLFYELDERREKDGRARTSRSSASSSCTRFRHRRLRKIIEQYPNAKDFVWVQEEPANQVRGRSWVYGCLRCCRISSAVCAGIAPRDVGTVVGFRANHGAKEHRHRVRRPKPFRRLRCVTGDQALQTW